MCDYRQDNEGYISSCNKNFKIHYTADLVNDRPGKIYIRKKLLDETLVHYEYLQPCNAEADEDIPNGYVCYKYSFPTFVNDCLKFAEGLTIHDPGIDTEECILQDKFTRKIFGDTDEKNMNIAIEAENKKYAKNVNENANPEIGESYAFVLKKIIGKKEAPYHIAHVLFKDGTTNITLEANAGDEAATQPKFDMYDTELDSEYTFHEMTIDNFDKSYQTKAQKSTIKDYITIVLQKRKFKTSATKTTSLKRSKAGSKIKTQQKSRNSKQTKKNKRI
jgi:hypothetical protein